MPRLLVFALFLTMLAVPLASLPFPAHAEEEGGKPAAKGGEEGGEGAAKPKKDSDVSGGRFAGDPVYVHLAPMILPVINDDGVQQIVTIQIDIQVKDFDVADNIHSNMPRVMDSLLRHLYGGLGQGSLRDGKLVDVGRVKKKATAALDEVIGADGVKDVLIQGVAQRML